MRFFTIFRAEIIVAIIFLKDYYVHRYTAAAGERQKMAASIIEVLRMYEETREHIQKKEE